MSIVFKMRASSEQRADASFKPTEVFYIDADQNKKYHILKDEKGKWLAGPLEALVSPKDTYRLGEHLLSKGKSVILWMKFPVPPVENPKIEINLPGVVPFSDVEIAK